jgi:hypothetical protein
VAALISSLDQATPAWLTAVLRAAGMIGQAAVSTIEMCANAAFNSSVAHLDITYSGAVPAATPRRLLLKLNANHDGSGEVGFYQLLATLPDRLPMLARCYAAEYDSSSGTSYLLLHDLSNTHAAPVTREQILALEGVPTDAQLNQMVDALARYHAYWWQHPRLGAVQDVTQVRDWYSDKEHFDRHVQRREREWARFSADVGGWFPADLRALYEDALARLSQLWGSYLARRVISFKNLTLTNGDCYFNQFLCSIDPAGAACLIDFQDVSANVGAYDLVYMFATFWTPAQRGAGGREQRLLRRYQAGLQASGVRGYSWDDLLIDYRHMIIFMLFDPIWNHTSGSTQAYWWPKLQCLTDAYRDLRCAELLR